jgi:hypothetical protein
MNARNLYFPTTSFGFPREERDESALAFACRSGIGMLHLGKVLSTGLTRDRQMLAGLLLLLAAATD